jgi:hypothetical protein
MKKRMKKEVKARERRGFDGAEIETIVSGRRLCGSGGRKAKRER